MKNISLKSFYINLFVSIVLVVVILSSFLLYFLIVGKSVERVQRDDLWLVSQLCETAKYLSDTAENISASIAFDPEIQSLMINYEYNTESGMTLDDIRLSLNKSLVNKANFNRALYECRNIILFSNEGRVIGSKEPFDSEVVLYSYPWSESVVQSTGKAIWLPLSFDENSPATKNSLSIPIVRKVYSTQSSVNNTFDEVLTLGKPLGYILIYFDNSMFSKIVSEYSRTSKRFFIVDSNNIIISSEDSNDIGSQFKFGNTSNNYIKYGNEEFLITEMDIDSLGWKYICLTERAEVKRDGDIVITICLILAFLLSCAFVVVSFFLSQSTSKPIHLLVDSFHQAEKGNVRIEEESFIKEFQDLYNSFNHTIATIYDLNSRIYKVERDKQELALSIKESKIQALQNQINPHFLYNTLDSINWQAQLDGCRDVSDMICTLGKFFRSNIRISENEIPLEVEIENARLYFELSKFRFGNRLECTIDVEPDLKRILVLRLLLQPLLENSIKHGIEKSGEKERIEIKIIKDEGKLLISVKDDGPGMSLDMLSYLEQLWREAGEEYHKETRSIGLYNVFRRLALTYYNDVSLSIFSKEGEGTEFLIRIPMKKTE